MLLTEPLEVTYSKLFSFAKDKLVSIRHAISITELSSAFHLPLSAEAVSELRDLQRNLTGFVLSPSAKDTWNIVTSKTGSCIPSKIYKLHFQHIPNHFPSKWIWKSKCMSKHKLFAWIILHNRINTHDMLLTRHWNVSSSHDCVLCPLHVLEDWSHLFFECNFSVCIWSYLQILWGVGSGPEMIKFAKKHFKGPCFTEVLILSCWNIWKNREMIGSSKQLGRPSYLGIKVSY
jgi:hypothetical protein